MKNKWISPTKPLLIRTDRMMAIGDYKKSIFIIGGFVESTQLTEYDITNNIFIDHGQTVLSGPVYGFGDFYIQINHTVYMIEPYGAYLSSFNLKNKTFQSHLIDIPINVYMDSCLTANNDYIFVVGGWNSTTKQSMNQLQILNISSLQWISQTNIPSMQSHRSDLTCAVSVNHAELYAIGGGSNSVEKLNITDIDNIADQQWEYIDNLMHKTSYSRSVVVNDSILIVGGYDLSDNTVLDSVEIINTSDCSISLGHRLKYAIQYTSVIIVNDIIYSFGGLKSDQLPTNRWQYSHLSLKPDENNSSFDYTKMIIVFASILAMMSICCGLFYFSCKHNKKSKKSNLSILRRLTQLSRSRLSTYDSINHAHVLNTNHNQRKEGEEGIMNNNHHDKGIGV